MLRHCSCLFLILFAYTSCAHAGHLHKERYYQEAWCSQHNGIIEYVLDDRTRVDCLTDEYAVEVDFAEKWAEAIGQALFYALKTGKKPGIVLIMENPIKDSKHLKRLQVVAKHYKIMIWTVK